MEYDVEAEIERYKQLAARLEPYITDTVTLLGEPAVAGRVQ